jgi:hypothetical protein
MKRLIFIVALVALLAPIRQMAQNVDHEMGAVEQLLGLQVDPEGVTFQVFSGGCTRKEDFRIERFQSDPTQLLLIRVVPDTCEAFLPYGTAIQYSYESLGLDNGRKFIVLNPRAPVTVVKTSPP